MGSRKSLLHQDPNLPHLNSQSPSLSSVGYQMYVVDSNLELSAKCYFSLDKYAL